MTVGERIELDKLLDMYYSDNDDSSELALYMILSNYSHLVLMWYMDGNGDGYGNGNGYGYGNGNGNGSSYGYGYGEGDGNGNGDGSSYGDGYDNGYGDTPQVLTIIRRMEAA